MGINNFQDMIAAAKQSEICRVAVACAEDEHVLKAVNAARNMGLIHGVLVGESRKIENCLQAIGACSRDYEIVNEIEKPSACDRAVALVKQGDCDLIMKGLVDTAVILRSALNKEHGIRCGGLLSQVNVVRPSIKDKLYVISDTAININPSLEEKMEIVKNAATVARALGFTNPRIAMVCPIDKVNEKMESTIHAQKITEMNRSGNLVSDCTVSGPMQLDIAISKEAAEHKGVLNDPVAGNANVIVLPNLDAGNILIKALEHFTESEKSGVTMGAGVPIILSSRASTSEVKLNSIALSILVSNYIKKDKG